MSSPRRRFVLPNVCMLAMALAMSGIVVACTDTTSPVVSSVEQPAPPLPSLTWQGASGSRTATLVGTNIVLENGTRLSVDAATASNFRRLAISMPKMEALAKRMTPVWARMGLPAPTSELQARAALAAFRSRSASTASVDGVLALTAPIKGPTLVAECDPTMQFCGFDTGVDPSAGDGGGGAGSSAGSGQSGNCERLGYQLYQSIGAWRAALVFYDLALNRQSACVQYYGPTWSTMCWFDAALFIDAMMRLNLATYQMESAAQAMRALGCV
ncbi:MAG: hypothetical protein JWL61_2314 [Gemmatimonadetes bacterium]|nr:hypothetical protein [Gemmatimonadota bacterium]